MMTFKHRLGAALLAASASAAPLAGPGQAEELTFEGQQVIRTTYDAAGGVDLLTAGLGVAGIVNPVPPAIADPLHPTPDELRTLAIYNNTRALVDPTDLGGYGRIYGAGVPLAGQDAVDEFIFGDEFLTFSDRGATDNVTMMVQVPFSFDPALPCMVTGASSGSRGVYGAIGTSGEWGLKRGCVVVYTDKGTGTGAHDLSRDTVNLIQGERADADAAGPDSTFTARLSQATQAGFVATSPNRFAFKHAHSGRNPEALWGQHVLDSIRFGFFVLNEVIEPERFPDAGPFTPEATFVIASSVSNGGGSAVLAAEQDTEGLIDAVAVSEPNVNPTFDDRFVIVQGSRDPVANHSQPLYEYTTVLNVFQGCANLANPDAPTALTFQAQYEARCASLAAKGLVTGTTVADQAADAQRIINEAGLVVEQNLVQPIQWLLNVPQAVAVTYANAYGRASVRQNLCGYSFGATVPVPAEGDPPPDLFQPTPLPETAEEALFATSNGIPPTGGVDLINDRSPGGPLANRFSLSPSTGAADENLDGALCLRGFATGTDPVTGAALQDFERRFAERVQGGISEILATGDLGGRPAIFVTGRADAILPINHTSRAYFGLNALVEGDDSGFRYVEILNAQHLDALIPVFPTTFIPLHHYFIQALDLTFAHLTEGAPLPDSQVLRTTPRAEANQQLTLDNLPPIPATPADADRIVFTGSQVIVPE